ncbi:DUF58 domain-containing protein [Cupriavidus basilensis]|nr:DUF58 domain-containing protein [Cupriavidus basilensis]
MPVGTRVANPASRPMRASELGTVWVDAAHLARLELAVRDLGFTMRQPHASVLSGKHGSRIRGRGLNFEELRGYQQGDDIRHLDWKASLRTGRPLVRVYTEERDLPVLLVVDQRMPMFFGSRRAMKSVLAAEFAALCAWMALQAGDRVGAVVFNDSEATLIRPLRSRARVQAVLGAIVRMNQALHADSAARPVYGQLDRALERALQLAGHDHLVCVVSDFAGAGQRTQDLLRQLSGHNSVIAAMVFDPLFQAVPHHTGRMVVTEGQLQVELDMGNKTTREPIESFFTGRLHDVTELLKRSGVPMMPIDTQGEALAQLRHFLGRLAPRGKAPGRY